MYPQFGLSSLDHFEGLDLRNLEIGVVFSRVPRENRYWDLGKPRWSYFKCTHIIPGCNVGDLGMATLQSRGDTAGRPLQVG